MLKSLLAASLIVTGLALPAGAMPSLRTDMPAAPVTEVYGGCGIYAHRGPYGGCLPGGQAGYVPYRAWPPGWHLGPNGRRCWRN